MSALLAVEQTRPETFSLQRADKILRDPNFTAFGRFLLWDALLAVGTNANGGNFPLPDVASATTPVWSASRNESWTRLLRTPGFNRHSCRPQLTPSYFPSQI